MLIMGDNRHMDVNESTQDSDTKPGIDTVLGILATVLVLSIIIVASAYFVGPSGQRLGAGGFIAFWLRELLFLGFLLVTTVFWAGARIWPRSRA